MGMLKIIGNGYDRKISALDVVCNEDFDVKKKKILMVLAGMVDKEISVENVVKNIPFPRPFRLR